MIDAIMDSSEVEHLSAAAVRSLEAAAELAPEGGSPREAHLLASLCAKTESLAGTILARLVTDRKAFQSALAHPGRIPGGLLRDVVSRADEAAEDMGCRGQLGSEFLLLALSLGTGPVANLLAEDGVTPDAVRTEIERFGIGVSNPTLAEAPDLDLADATEAFDLLRVIDANANRAREAIRVLEDHARFALDDGDLASRFKELRHDLSQTLAQLPRTELLESRDTLRDVGTGLETEGERSRGSRADVVTANVKRLQEALRVLEEYGKITGASIGRRMQDLRYRTYTLEKAIVLTPSLQQQLHGRVLYVLVTESLCAGPLEWTVKEALAGGADVIQLREKDLQDRALLDRARRVARWTREAGALFVVNDRPDIARLCDAAGVHVGQEELPCREARRVVGPGKLVGVSTHAPEQADAAVAAGASYLGVGPVFPSGTKVIDQTAGLQHVRHCARHIRIPWFAIGGIDTNNIGDVVQAGATRVAVSAAVIGASDPRHAAEAMKKHLATAGSPS